MHFAMLVLLTATVLLHEVSGLFPRAIPHILTKDVELPKKEYKRQTDIVQCVNDKLDAAFPGNNSRFVADCRYSATEEFELVDLTDSSNLQSLITSVFRTFCIAECGNVIMDAYNDCGYFDQIGLPGIEEFLIGLCGTNQYGDICYQLYSDALDLVTSEGSCYNYYVAYDQCDCRSTLLNGVAEQDCCLDVYHDFRADIGSSVGSNVKISELYDACNVELPTGCNNSPITSGSFILQITLITFLFALIFTVVLG